MYFGKALLMGGFRPAAENTQSFAIGCRRAWLQRTGKVIEAAGTQCAYAGRCGVLPHSLPQLLRNPAMRSSVAVFVMVVGAEFCHEFERNGVSCGKCVEIEAALREKTLYSRGGNMRFIMIPERPFQGFHAGECL